MFAVFAHDNYYPSGGWHDFRGFAPTRGEADALAQFLTQEWELSHVVDLTTGEVVSDFDPWRDKQEEYAQKAEAARKATAPVPPPPIVTEAVYVPTGEVLGNPQSGMRT